MLKSSLYYFFIILILSISTVFAGQRVYVLEMVGGTEIGVDSVREDETFYYYTIADREFQIKKTKVYAVKKQTQIDPEPVQSNQLNDNLSNEDEKCIENLTCWAAKNLADATKQAEYFIERMAKFDYQWINNPDENKLTYYKWYDKERLIIQYTGDKIKMQNGFGAFSHMTYKCYYDTINKKMIDIKLSKGKI